MVDIIKPLNGAVVMSQDLTKLRELFSKCSKVIAAVGDETRQSIVIALMEGGAAGMRVGALTEKTNLSRPAVSHHLKVLREAGIVYMYKKGTMNFYYLNSDKVTISNMLLLCQSILEAIEGSNV